MVRSRSPVQIRATAQVFTNTTKRVFVLLFGRFGGIIIRLNLIKHTMPQDNLLRMKCTVCKQANYYTSKNKKKVERKLEYSKFCKWCKKSTKHKEARMTG